MTYTPSRRLIFWTGLAVTFCVMTCQAALAQQSPITASGDSRQDAPKAAAVVAPPPGAAAPVDSSTYKVGPGDILNIDVWKQPEFSGVYTVHSDGKITMKLVNDLEAGGKTPNQIQTIVKDALTKYI